MANDADTLSSNVLPFSLDKLVLIAPLVGGSLAIVFDVGYLSAIDINYFTLFSLTEHVVFAPEAIPFVFVIVLGSGMLAAFLQWALSVPRRGRVDPKKTYKRRIFEHVFGYGGMLASGVWAYYNDFVKAAALAVFSIVLTLFGDFLRAVASEFIRANRATFICLNVLALSIATAYLFGHYNARKYSSESVPLHTLYMKQGPSRPARIIRAGERGILYADPSTRTIIFDRWDAIESIAGLSR
jgi:hypothetical protein